MKTFSQIILLLSFLFPTGCIAQQGELSTNNKKAAKRFEEARKFYEFRNAKDAAPLLKDAIEADPDFFEAHMLLANVLDDLEDYEGAILHYKEAIRLKPDRFPPNYYNLSGAEMQLGRYEDAMHNLEKFMGYQRINPELRKKAERRIANCRFAEQAIKNPVNFKPENLGEAVNSPYDEYHPAISTDETYLVFTRRRPRDAQSDVGISKFEEDFYYSRNLNGTWTTAMPLGPPVNSHGNEGAHCLSPDGNTLFFTACERKEGQGSCDLYVSQRIGNQWSEPQNLGILNSPFWDTQPTISANGQEIIFVSKRTGTLGGGDLYQSFRDKNGRWSTPKNMGTILNTPYDESGPFLHPDGLTLFFTSSGHPGMGGQDLFVSRRKADSTWTIPENLGYPINTSSDEEHLVVNALGDHAYYSSSRPGGLGGKDLYVFELPIAMRPHQVTYLKGIVSSTEGKALQAQVTVIDLNTGQQKAATFSDKQQGGFLVCIPSGSSYAINVTAPGYLFYSENYTLGSELGPEDRYHADIHLQAIQKGNAVILKNIFFESGSSQLMPASVTELDKLNEFLVLNPAVQIEIAGHTDNVGNDADNMKLSEKRAQSVVDFLISKGIQASRLQAKGYGKTKPIADNSSPEGRSRNRRTEFSIIKP